MAQYMLRVLLITLSVVCHEGKPRVAPTVISPKMVNQTISVNEGELASFTCEVIGNPIPIITFRWYCKDILVDEANTLKYTVSSLPVNTTTTTIKSELVILKVESSDAGIYKCIATNILSTGTSSGILTVNVAPSIVAPMEGQQFNIKEEKNLSITCTATGYPAPTVSWQGPLSHGRFNSIIIYTHGKPMLTGDGNVTSASITLIMMRAIKNDTGIYRCKATNQLRTTILTINVLYDHVDADFYFGFFKNTKPSILITNSNPFWVSYFIEAPGIQFDRKGNIAPNSIKTIAFPITLEMLSNDADKGIHLQMNNTYVTVLGQNSVNKSITDTFLIMPYSKLCVDEYVYYGISVNNRSDDYSVILIVGIENNTKVKLTVTQLVTINIGGGFFLSTNPGEEYPFMIGALQTVFIESHDDLSGTRVVTNKPVSLLSGHQCTRAVADCDHSIEQIPPITFWGRKHYTVPLAGRSYNMKILAGYDFTTIDIYCNDAWEQHTLEKKGEFITMEMKEYCAVYSDKKVLTVQFSHGNPMMTLVPAFKDYSSKIDVSTIHASDFVHHINIIVTAHCFQPNMMYLVTAEGIQESLDSQQWVQIKVNSTEVMYATQMKISEGMVKIIHTMSLAEMGVIVYGFANNKGYGHVGWNFSTGPFPHITTPPSSQIINLDTNNYNVSLSCETDRRLSIAWERENDIIPHNRTNGTYNSILTLINLQPEDAGKYRCVVSHRFFESCNSEYAMITINVVGPSIVTQPNDTYAAAPFSGVFKCSAKGYGYISISWYKANTWYDIKSLPDKDKVSTVHSSEATVSTLEIPNLIKEDAGGYICVVHSKYNGNSRWSRIATLYISDPPIPPTVNTTSVMPIYLNINNYSLSLECVSMVKNGFNYTWEKRNSSLPLRRIQQEDPQMTINNLRLKDSGYYRCVVSNSTGEIASRYIEVKVKASLPVIMVQPVSIVVNVTDDIIMKCTVRSYGDVKITWKKLNSTLPSSAVPKEIKSINEITSILNISNAIGYYKGYYYATISNIAGEINSSMVYLNVSVPCPEIITPPVPTTVRSGETTNFHCLAWSYGELTYQWKRSGNSTLPSNAAVHDYTTKSQLVISNAQELNEGNYCCVATNECGDTIRCAWLKVKTSIKFIIQPNISVEYKENKTNVNPFQCLTSGAGSTIIHYLWEKYDSLNDNWIRPSDRVVNVTSHHLVFSMITAEDEGTYHCVATNHDDTVVSNSSNITVYGPVIIKYISQNVVTYEGEDVALMCNVTNDIDSDLKITWYHEGNLVDNAHTDYVAGQAKSVLKFSPVHRTDGGEYKCSALNHLQCVAEAKTNLTVEYGPIVLIDNSPQPPGEILYVGDKKSLVCTTEGLPTPTVQWYKDNQPVDSVALPSYKPLKIPSNTPYISMYKCVASNFAGNKRHTSELTITVEVKASCHKLSDAGKAQIVYDNKEITVFKCKDTKEIFVLRCTDGEWDGNQLACGK